MKRTSATLAGCFSAPFTCPSVLFLQQADLVSLGKVVLALACNSLAGIQRENLQKAMELVSLNYSSDLKNLIL